MNRPRVLLAYHFFHPDEVVSARLFSDFALGLERRGWSVTVLTSDRVWGRPSERLASRERWNGVAIERVHRPAWAQNRPVSRLLNSAWMVPAWLAAAPRLGPFDAVVVGSDPAFAPLFLGPLRRLWPRTALIHWCFDLYPEAIAADGTGRLLGAFLPAARAMMAHAYRQCDAIVDLGPRMRERLAEYPSAAVRQTLIPWALTEGSFAAPSAHSSMRQEIFGDARLALLYSGTLGRAHDFDHFLRLARAARSQHGNAFRFAFSARGSRADELRRSLRPDDTNLTTLPFGDEAELAGRLEAADIHLLSLRDEWSGIVVPSKFFGSLAVGRPVLYSGPGDSDVARWIGEFGVGWCLDPRDLQPTLDDLASFAASPSAQSLMQAKARSAYVANFQRELIIDRWNDLLRSLVRQRGTPQRERARSLAEIS